MTSYHPSSSQFDPTLAVPQLQSEGSPFVVGRFHGLEDELNATGPMQPAAPAPAPVPPPPAPAPPGAPRRRKPWLAIVGVALLASLAGGAAVLAFEGERPAAGEGVGEALGDAVSSTTLAEASTATASDDAPAPADSPPPAPAPEQTSTSSTPPAQDPGSTTSTTQPPAPPAPPAPMVTAFNTPDSVLCPDSATQDIYISWATEDADEVVLSIDGSGAFATYPASTSSDVVPFACDLSPHTYTLVAKAGGDSSVEWSVTIYPLMFPVDDMLVEVMPEL